MNLILFSAKKGKLILQCKVMHGYGFLFYFLIHLHRAMFFTVLFFTYPNFASILHFTLFFFCILIQIRFKFWALNRLHLYFSGREKVTLTDLEITAETASWGDKIFYARWIPSIMALHLKKKKNSNRRWQEMKDEERLSFLHLPYAKRKTVKLAVI